MRGRLKYDRENIAACESLIIMEWPNCQQLMFAANLMIRILYIAAISRPPRIQKAMIKLEFVTHKVTN